MSKYYVACWVVDDVMNRGNKCTVHNFIGPDNEKYPVSSKLHTIDVESLRAVYDLIAKCADKLNESHGNIEALYGDLNLTEEQQIAVEDCCKAKQKLEQIEKLCIDWCKRKDENAEDTEDTLARIIGVVL